MSVNLALLYVHLVSQMFFEVPDAGVISKKANFEEIYENKIVSSTSQISM